MENAVFIELKRRNRDIYYWKDKRDKEVDFVVREGQDIKIAIQVCADPEDAKTVQREVNGLKKLIPSIVSKRL